MFYNTIMVVCVAISMVNKSSAFEVLFLNLYFLLPALEFFFVLNVALFLSLLLLQVS